jgi:hypothetical protein
MGKCAPKNCRSGGNLVSDVSCLCVRSKSQRVIVTSVTHGIGQVGTVSIRTAIHLLSSPISTRVVCKLSGLVLCLLLVVIN